MSVRFRGSVSVRVPGPEKNLGLPYRDLVSRLQNMALDGATIDKDGSEADIMTFPAHPVDNVLASLTDNTGMVRLYMRP
jgi:hypothetical protein